MEEEGGWEAWTAVWGWLQSPVVRFKVQHSGPGSRKPIPHVLSQSRAQRPAHQATVRGSGSSSWPGQLQRNWVKSTKKAVGIEVRGWDGKGEGRLLPLSLLWA